MRPWLRILVLVAALAAVAVGAVCLRRSFGIPVRRHRLFELGGWEPQWPVPGCRHGDFTERIFPGSTNRPRGRTVCNIGEYRVPLPVQKGCMRLDDIFSPVTMHELSEMVPPCMTEYLGTQLLLDRT